MTVPPVRGIQLVSPYTRYVLDHLPNDLPRLRQLHTTLLAHRGVTVIDLERVAQKIEELESAEDSDLPPAA